jgi:6-pyruvoyltetrahydropterin/6-carboxytetrahydropterin synthase
MFECSVTTMFSAAHKIDGYDGDCANLHGHNWHVEALVQGDVLDDIGILVDFKIIKRGLKQVLKPLDHAYLNDVLSFSTTAENLSKYIYDELSALLDDEANLKSVSIYETPRSKVTYTPNAKSKARCTP